MCFRFYDPPRLESQCSLSRHTRRVCSRCLRALLPVLCTPQTRTGAEGFAAFSHGRRSPTTPMERTEHHFGPFWEKDFGVISGGPFFSRPLCFAAEKAILRATRGIPGHSRSNSRNSTHDLIYVKSLFWEQLSELVGRQSFSPNSRSVFFQNWGGPRAVES